MPANYYIWVEPVEGPFNAVRAPDWVPFGTRVERRGNYSVGGVADTLRSFSSPRPGGVPPSYQKAETQVQPVALAQRYLCTGNSFERSVTGIGLCRPTLHNRGDVIRGAFRHGF